MRSSEKERTQASGQRSTPTGKTAAITERNSWAAKGFSNQASAPARLAMNVSARLSSSSTIGRTPGVMPFKALVIAMPPIEPTCMSTIARSAPSATATSSASYGSVTLTISWAPLSAARTWFCTHGTSLTSNTFMA